MFDNYARIFPQSLYSLLRVELTRNYIVVKYSTFNRLVLGDIVS